MVWRTIRARDWRTPAGLYSSLSAGAGSRYPDRPEWIHELKWDGYRLIARRENDIVHQWSRAGRNWAGDFPLIGNAMARLPAENVIVDGEAVCLLEDGRPDFHALRSPHACRDARLIAYDLLALDGEDLRKLPLRERRKRLKDLLSC